MDRRRLLSLALAGALPLAWPRLGVAQRRDFGFDPFTLGVASGSPGADSVVLWTRLLAPRLFESLGAQPVEVLWEVAQDERFSRIVQRGSSMADGGLAHSVHVEVSGLQPDRWYHYRFHAGGATSATGRTRTLPAPDARPSRLRVGYASCQRWEHGHYAAWRHMRTDEPDLVLFLGDYIYEYPNATAAVRDFPTLGLVHTLAEYRERHALHRSDAALQAMHAACPWLVTWDDHEVQNDYAGVHPGDARPLGLNGSTDFAARRSAAYQAYWEHMPLRAADFVRAASGVQVQLYRRVRWGVLADILMLDTRQWRDRQPCASDKRPGGVLDPAACPTWNDPARTLLGPAQEQWLQGELASGAGAWTVFGQQTVFGQRDNHPGPGVRLFNDGWDGYAAARRRITDALQRHRSANPVFLGGDVHENWVGHVKADYARPGSAAVGVEFCGTSITSRSGSAGSVARRLADNPHFIFADGYRRGYGICDFTPRLLTTTLRTVQDVSRADSGIDTLAVFAVDAGRPLVERVG